MLQNKQQIKVRNSSIELLRIIAMIMIVFHHFAIHGGFTFGASISITYLWYNLIVMGGKIGVDVFVIISGYYLITDEKPIFNINRIIKFVGQILFYSVVVFFVGGLAGFGDFGAKSVIKVFFPITFSKWWFASTYFVLYLIHPFINKLLNSMDKLLYQKFLLVLVTCWSVIPTFTTSSYQGNSLLWFVTLYSISGYVRLYGLNNKLTIKHYFILWIVCSFLTYASSVLFIVLGNKWSIFAEHATYFYGQEKVTILLISLSLFMIFATLKMNHCKWINVLASVTFGVYLLHDNDIARKFLWDNLFNNAQYQDSLFLIPYSIVAVVAVYAVCTCFDLLRQSFFEKPFMILVNCYSEKMIKPVEMILNAAKSVIFGEGN